MKKVKNMFWILVTFTLDNIEAKSHSCSTCDKSFRKKTSLSKHIERWHNEKKVWKCSACDKSFTRNKVLTTHMVEVHNIKRDSKWGCKKCGATFTTNMKLVNHKKEAHAIISKCPQCSEEFKSEEAVMRHLSENHPDVKVSKFQKQIFLFSFQPKLYIPSTPNNSNETHTFMCLGRTGRFGQR